jgi:hypothetical protein
MRECASKCVSVNEGVRYCVCVCEYVHMLVRERVSLYFCVNMFYFNLKNIHHMVLHNGTEKEKKKQACQTVAKGISK